MLNPDQCSLVIEVVMCLKIAVYLDLFHSVKFVEMNVYKKFVTMNIDIMIYYLKNPPLSNRFYLYWIYQ